ncbi:MAG: NADH-quinone oxidoreductase subunit K [bacterium]
MNNLGLLLILSGVLFCLGIFGVLIHRNLLRILICIELLFVSTIINFVIFNSQIHHEHSAGFIFALVILFLSTLMTAMGIFLIFALHKSNNSLLEDKLNVFKG